MNDPNPQLGELLGESLRPFPNKAVAIATAFVAGAVAVACLYLFYFAPGLTAVWFIFYNVTFVAAAWGFRAGFDCRAFGIASLSAVALAIVIFMLSAVLIKRDPTPADPVGASSMTDLFALVVFPFLFVPITLPAFPCWAASLAFEKWPVVWYVLTGICAAIAILLNLFVGMWLVSSPDLIENLYR